MSGTTPQEDAAKKSKRRNRPKKPKQQQQQQQDSEEEEGEMCMVCSEVRGWWGVWVPCGHGVCWRCALRIRYMSPDDPKSQWCCICQRESGGICIKEVNNCEGIAEREEKYLKDEKGWQVWYETEEMQRDVEYLRGWYCHCWEDCGVESAFKDFAGLQKHLSAEHGVSLCEPCTKGNTKFPSEQTLYTKDQLRIHHRPDRTCHKDLTSFPGHPLCHFCSKLLYDNDALYLHMREAHVLCDLCEANPEGEKLVFYRNHRALFAHMDAAHVKCKTCERNYHELQRRGMGVERHPTEWTFSTELELERHNKQEHGGSKEAVGNAARSLLSFSYSGDGRGRGNGERQQAAPGEQASVITFDLGGGRRKTMRLSALPQARATRRKADEKNTLEIVLKDIGAGEAALQNAKNFLKGTLRVVEYYSILQTCVGDVNKIIDSVVKAVPDAEKREALRLAHNMATDTEREKGETMRNFAKAVNNTADFPTLAEDNVDAAKPSRAKGAWASKTYTPAASAPSMSSTDDFPSLSTSGAPSVRPTSAWGPPTSPATEPKPRTSPKPVAAPAPLPPKPVLDSLNDFPTLGGSGGGGGGNHPALRGLKPQPKKKQGAWGR